MIYTLTLNPAIDKIILMEEELNLSKTNYYNDEYSVVGGKGINVGIILNNLKSDVVLTGLLGKDNMSIFTDKFNEIKIKSEFILIDGNTRTNYKIKNLIKKQETELNGSGFNTKTEDINKMLDYLKTNVKDGDIIVATGSLPKNVSSDIYNQVGKIANNAKALFICDAAKDALRNALNQKPYLIKPNIDELKDLLAIKNDDESFKQIETLISETKKLGARNILLSMGSDGSYYFTEKDEIYKVGIAKGKLINSVGAGDSMLAGFIYGLEKNLTVEETLKYAASAGGATAFTEWLATKDEIQKYINEISVEKVK